MSQRKQIIRLDASAVGRSSCLLCLYNTVVLGHSSKYIPNDIHYGSCFHAFKETLAKTKNDTLAIQAAIKLWNGQENLIIKPDKKYLDAHHLVQTCIKYLAKFGTARELDNFETLDLSGSPLVEQKFGIPYYVDDEVEVLLMGTIDDIGKFKNNGCYAFGDEKTTASWSKEKYLSSYELSHQLLFYRFAIEWFSDNYPDSVFRRITKDKLGAFINGVFVGANKDTEFHRSDIIYFNQGQLNEFRRELDALIARLIIHVKNGKRPNRQGLLNGACNSHKFPCNYISACKMAREEDYEAVLNKNFSKREYNPLNFGGGQSK
jgi:hypothetical protein